MNRFLVTTLAEYQTRFWLAVARRLREAGSSVAFVSFDDRSTEMLEADGFKVFAGRDPRDTAAAQGSDRPGEGVLERFGIADLNFWITHERFAFGLTDSAAMRRKLEQALLGADRACREWTGPGRTVMVQELGGFLSVIGSFFAARHHGIDNWFIEPSFFRGRMFFLRNTFAAMAIDMKVPASPSAELARYLEDTLRTGAIVVPLKDRHQYTTARRKIVNWRNARRLFEKVVDKHVRGKQHEFGHIGSHVGVHARMLLDSHRLRNRYTPLEACGRFVYYPLHVPGDMALTLRTPHLLDQLALIDYLCRSVPASHRVVVKEHPAMVGAVSAVRLIDLLRRYDNLALVAPSTNNYKVLGAAELIVSINSKSGAEAGLVGKPVVVLGDAFYRSAPFAQAVERLQDLPARIGELLDPARRRPDEAAIRDFFARVWQRTWPGELYVTEPDNVAVFAESMRSATA